MRLAAANTYVLTLPLTANPFVNVGKSPNLSSLFPFFKDSDH